MRAQCRPTSNMAAPITPQPTAIAITMKTPVETPDDGLVIVPYELALLGSYCPLPEYDALTMTGVSKLGAV